MVKKADLIKKYGSEEAVSEYYRELQKKSRENYKGTGGFASLAKTDPEKLSEISRKAANKRHAAEKAAREKDSTQG